MIVEWASEAFEPLPERALHWTGERTLLVADAHFGKAAAFRAAGLPVPGGTTSANLQRLDAMLDRTGAERLVFLGDLLHARAGRARDTMRLIGAWRAAHRDLEIILVRGNHDVSAGDPPDDWSVRCVDEPFVCEGIELCHEPPSVPAPDRPAIAGHVHPVVMLSDEIGGRMRLPCFCFGESLALLPAFGSFTGGKVIRPRARDRVIVVHDRAVYDVSASIRSAW